MKAEILDHVLKISKLAKEPSPRFYLAKTGNGPPGYITNGETVKNFDMVKTFQVDVDNSAGEITIKKAGTYKIEIKFTSPKQCQGYVGIAIFKNGERVAHVHNYHTLTMDVFDFETNDIITFEKESQGQWSCDVYFEKNQHALTLTGELVLYR